jgi:hypothetical protein
VSLWAISRSLRFSYVEKSKVDNDGRSNRRKLLFELRGGDDVDLPSDGHDARRADVVYLNAEGVVCPISSTALLLVGFKEVGQLLLWTQPTESNGTRIGAIRN